MAQDFSHWNPVIHENPEQLKRQKRAAEAALTPLSIHEATAVFKGTDSDYQTTLISCQCVDFGRRHLPCKHIYRLAHELGVFPLGPVKADPTVSVQIRIEDAMDIIQTFSPETIQVLFEQIKYFCGHDGCLLVRKSPEIDILMENHFIQRSDDFTILLKGYKKADLLAFLPEDEKNQLPKKTTKADLKELINQKYHPLLEEILGNNLIIQLHPSVAPLVHKLHRRLYNMLDVSGDDFWDGT